MLTSYEKYGRQHGYYSIIAQISINVKLIGLKMDNFRLMLHRWDDFLEQIFGPDFSAGSIDARVRAEIFVR